MTIFSSDPLTCRNQIYASSILLMLLQAVLLYLAPPTGDPRRFYLLILSQIFNIAMIQFSCAIVCTYKDVVLLHTKLLQLLFCHYYFGMGATVVSFQILYLQPPAWLVAFSLIPLLSACGKIFVQSILYRNGYKRQELDYLKSFHPWIMFYFQPVHRDWEDLEIEAGLPRDS